MGARFWKLVFVFGIRFQHFCHLVSVLHFIRGAQGPGERWEEVHDEADLPQCTQGHIMPPEVLEKHRLYRIGAAGPDTNLEKQLMLDGDSDCDDEEDGEDDDEEDEDQSEDEDDDGVRKNPVAFSSDGKPIRRPSAKIL